MAERLVGRCHLRGRVLRRDPQLRWQGRRALCVVKDSPDHLTTAWFRRWRATAPLTSEFAGGAAASAGTSWLRGRQKWLPPRHDCCLAATLTEDLTVIPARSCARRFLATPLHEIVPS